MITVLTAETGKPATVLSKNGKLTLDSFPQLEAEHKKFNDPETVAKYLAKDPANLTKSKTVKKNVLNKEIKRRTMSFSNFLVKQKKFKKVDHLIVRDR